MSEKILFTSESVSEGHPDKICDQISDAILDYCLSVDPNARVAAECFATTELIFVAGEITIACKKEQMPDYEGIARGVLRKIGYVRPELGIGADECKVMVNIKAQSPDIAQGVDRGDKPEDMGAGDQGIMFGYASSEDPGYMPLAVVIAHKLMRYASIARKKGVFKWSRPDMKSQVTIDYTDPKHPRVDTVLMSVQHEPDADLPEFKKYIYEKIMKPVVRSFGLNEDFKYLINPTGRFVIGGPEGDTGLTGRKIIVDTYGGAARHGGGSFSGKDPSKVDRSATYMARYIAKNLVAAGVAERLEVQLSYAIGVPDPLSYAIATFGTAHYSDQVILGIIKKVFDCRPGIIIRDFSLTHPKFKYQDLACYGHFGRPDMELPWEKLDKVEIIKALLPK